MSVLVAVSVEELVSMVFRAVNLAASSAAATAVVYYVFLVVLTTTIDVMLTVEAVVIVLVTAYFTPLHLVSDFPSWKSKTRFLLVAVVHHASASFALNCI